MNNYVYHILPEDLEGNIIYPLNQLLETNPSLYTKHAAKYKGREHLMDYIIPHLNVKWNDVVFFSGINPDLIWDELEKAGIFRNRMKFIKIPIEDLPENKTVVYSYKNVDVNVITKEEQVQPLKHSDYKELDSVPQRTIDYFNKIVADGKRPLNFVGIQHILLADSIDISKYL